MISIVSEKEIPEIPPNYTRMWKITEGLSPNGADILEIGCGKGEFVKFLREKGYNAYGIDIRIKPPLAEIDEWYFPKDIAHIDECLTGRLFDLIIANHVMSLDSTVDTLLNSYGREVIHTLGVDGRILAWDNNTKEILESSHNNLKQNGFFVSVEHRGERLHHNFKKYADELGYGIIEYSSMKQERAILQRQ